MDGSGLVWDDELAEGVSAVKRQDVRKALGEYARPNSFFGIKHFILDIGLYSAAIAGVLFLEPMWAKVLCSIVAGLKLANLGTMGHDAAHGNLVGSRKANDIMGIICFMPCLYNYRLWNHDHHNLHHIQTNVNHLDSWVPLSKAQFDALPKFRQMLHRLYRSSYGLGFAPYYLIERWMPVRFIPNKGLPREMRASAWAHLALLTTFAAVFIGGLAAAPLYSNTSSVTAVLLGFVLPFYLWMTLFSFTVYIQHTHRKLPWFDGPVHKKASLAQEALSTTYNFPGWIKYLMHNVYDHAAHHVHPRVPFYHLTAATKRLNELAPETAVTEPFSFKRLHETLKTCRLYDFENHRWLDFDGKPTTGVLVTEAERAAMIEHGPGVMYAGAKA